MNDPVVCVPKALPRSLWVPAALTATEINPVNHPRLERLSMIMPAFQPTAESIAVVTTKYWHTKGVKLTVDFLDNPPTALRKRILSHMNAWNKTTNVQFLESKTSPQVRIARTPGKGHWSYLGTDILSIQSNEPTMNLDSFAMNTPDSEFYRVVRHETGHTLGCPHEHMRKELVALIDQAKAISFFGATQGWAPDMVRRQVLTPIEQSSLLGTAQADPKSIMCYQIPGTITQSGKPIIGGLDIDKSDYEFMSKIYPKLTSGGSKSSKKVSAKKVTSKAAKKAGAKGSTKKSSKARKH
jgi:hypothetical protein